MANTTTKSKSRSTSPSKRTGRSSNGSTPKSPPSDPLRILKSDHRTVEDLLNRLAETEPGQEREDLVSELLREMVLHMQIEEEIVYPAVVSVLGSEPQEEAEVEHGLAREGMTKLQELIDAPGFGAAVEMLKAGVKHHVNEEEKEILPELRSGMERSDWKELGARILEAKVAAGAPMAETGRRTSPSR